jgi:DNA polymerase-4/DNA polymerase V
VDADSFFVACEQAMHPHLKGKPVITGAERGIVTAASYEAKASGVKRGMRIFEVRQVCPRAVILPSDYETYTIYSLRMFEILRRFSPEVEEYSMDEAFCDIKGLRRTFRCSYPEIARQIQATILRELNLSVSIGVSVSKVMAKIASKHQKPHGVTAIPGREIHTYLQRLPVSSVWGIGHNTANFLRKHNIFTAYEFAVQPEWWVKKKLSKPYQETWHELNGRSVIPVTNTEKTTQQSISRCKTFTPPSSDKGYVFAQLAQNLEQACVKARGYHLNAAHVVIYLKTQQFNHQAFELRLSHPTSHPGEILSLVRSGFEQIYQGGSLYRTTGVVLAGLKTGSSIQRTLFEDQVKIEKQKMLHSAVDELAKKFGRQTVILGASLAAKKQEEIDKAREFTPWRKANPLPGESNQQRLGILLLDIEV